MYLVTLEILKVLVLLIMFSLSISFEVLLVSVMVDYVVYSLVSLSGAVCDNLCQLSLVSLPHMVGIPVLH